MKNKKELKERFWKTISAIVGTCLVFAGVYLVRSFTEVLKMTWNNIDSLTCQQTSFISAIIVIIFMILVWIIFRIMEYTVELFDYSLGKSKKTKK